jgi:hypothetical protein
MRKMKIEKSLLQPRNTNAVGGNRMFFCRTVEEEEEE